MMILLLQNKKRRGPGKKCHAIETMMHSNKLASKALNITLKPHFFFFTRCENADVAVIPSQEWEVAQRLGLDLLRSIFHSGGTGTGDARCERQPGSLANCCSLLSVFSLVFAQHVEQHVGISEQRDHINQRRNMGTPVGMFLPKLCLQF